MLLKLFFFPHFTDELKAQLDYYVATRLPPGIVRIVRLSKRSGLIRTRIAGAKAAQAPVVVFLDSHCEAGIDWFALYFIII